IRSALAGGHGGGRHAPRIEGAGDGGDGGSVGRGLDEDADLGAPAAHVADDPHVQTARGEGGRLDGQDGGRGEGGHAGGYTAGPVPVDTLHHGHRLQDLHSRVARRLRVSKGGGTRRGLVED